MMKKIVLISILAVVVSVNIATAQSLRKLFVAMPDSVCVLLTADNRADFVDFLDNGMKAVVSNRLGGKSEMTKLTDDFLNINMSEVSTWQMRLLATNDTTKVVCLVSTVCATACDSHVRFFDKKWNELDASEFLPSLPTIDDYLQPLPDTASYSLRDARLQSDVVFAKASLSPEAETLTFTFSTTDYMDPEAADLLRPYVKQPVVYQWIDGKFRR